MTIKRDSYLKKLAAQRNNGRIKIITGIRRCGKSYLLFTLYKNWLISQGVSEKNIITVALDDDDFAELRNPLKLKKYITQRIESDSEQYYVFIDEIQLSYKVKNQTDEQVAPEDEPLLYTTFYDILNSLAQKKNIDLYVTGSNSRLLSKDVATNFRDRGDEIQIFPLSFSEFYEAKNLEKADAWEEYLLYGGMPLAVLKENDEEKSEYLSSLFDLLYLKDLRERYNLKDDFAMDNLIKILFSSVGSLTNPHKLACTMESVLKLKISDATVKNYLSHLEDAFIFSKAERFDVKGKSYFDYPMKFYATDIGLRNARLNFRQIERTHLMENIIYNELKIRGYKVDVGVVEIVKTSNGKRNKSQHEIDFVVNKGFQKIYIQSAFNIEEEAKRNQETLPFFYTGDFYKKIVITDGNAKEHSDENGIIYIGIIPFLLEKDFLEK